MELGFSKDSFEPLRRIGEGGNAKVYEAIEAVSKKRVAIRCFKKKLVLQNGHYKVLENISRSPFLLKWMS